MTETMDKKANPVSHKYPLLGVLCIVVFTLIVVLGAVVTKQEPVNVAEASILQHRDLYFRDVTGGKVNVYDAKSKQRIGSFNKGEGAFVRISMRAMAHQRKQKEIDQKLPYRVVKLEDGNLKIIDPQSGHGIRLNAFGPIAIESFAQFLTDQTGKGAQG